MELASLDAEEAHLCHGFELRDARREDLAQLFAFLKPMLWDADVRYATSARCDLSLWAVAWKGQEIAGSVINEIEAGVGRTPWVAVGNPFRRRGLARALLSTSLLKMRERGARRAEI